MLRRPKYSFSWDSKSGRILKWKFVIIYGQKMFLTLKFNYCVCRHCQHAFLFQNWLYLIYKNYVSYLYLMGETVETQKKPQANQLSRYSLFCLKRSCDFWKVLPEFTNKKSHKQNKYFGT